MAPDDRPSPKKGRLFVVATPIGNLEDITLRALRILRDVEAVACEDTRRTVKILNSHGIKKRLLSYYQPHESRRIPQILSLLESGRDIALVTDAGTPAISDPGYPLLRDALDRGVEVVPIPGPCALTAAISASGLPAHRFLFLGFPPPKAAGQKKLLESLAGEKGTLVFYLPARKAVDFLEAVRAVLGDRPVVIARELTKIHEEFIRGSAESLAEEPRIGQLKGETVVLIGGAGRSARE
jgi:16S rRNA (cytidine1402-2'-O)-methyltransferase